MYLLCSVSCATETMSEQEIKYNAGLIKKAAVKLQ